MKIVSMTEIENESVIYTVVLEPGVFVDVKRTDDGFYYIMQCEDGYETFDDNGNTFDYRFDFNNVVRFVELNRSSITQ